MENDSLNVQTININNKEGVNHIVEDAAPALSSDVIRMYVKYCIG